MMACRSMTVKKVKCQAFPGIGATVALRLRNGCDRLVYRCVPIFPKGDAGGRGARYRQGPLAGTLADLTLCRQCSCQTGKSVAYAEGKCFPKIRPGVSTPAGFPARTRQ